LKGDGKGSVQGRWSQSLKCENAARTVWHFQKPAWNVGEFYFVRLGGNPDMHPYDTVGYT